MHILEELWNGSVCPISQTDYRRGDYLHLVQLHEKNESSLLTTLNQTQKDDLQKLSETIEEMRNIAECSAFITGFRLAVQLMIAAAAE